MKISLFWRYLFGTRFLIYIAKVQTKVKLSAFLKKQQIITLITEIDFTKIYSNPWLLSVKNMSENCLILTCFQSLNFLTDTHFKRPGRVKNEASVSLLIAKHFKYLEWPWILASEFFTGGGAEWGWWEHVEGQREGTFKKNAILKGWKQHTGVEGSAKRSRCDYDPTQPLSRPSSPSVWNKDLTL